MEIRLENSLLRNFVIEDAASIAKYANNYNIAKNLRAGFPFPYTIKDAETFIKNTFHTKHINLAIEVNSEACGVIGLIYHHTKVKDAELGFWLAEEHWNKGIITEATKGIIDFGFRELQLNRIYSFCLVNNIGSKKVHDKVGFNYLGIVKDKCTSASGERLTHAFEFLKEMYGGEV